MSAPAAPIFPSPPALRLAGVTKRFAAARKGAAPVLALDDIELELRTGEVLGLVGPDGAGERVPGEPLRPGLILEAIRGRMPKRGDA